MEFRRLWLTVVTEGGSTLEYIGRCQRKYALVSQSVLNGPESEIESEPDTSSSRVLEPSDPRTSPDADHIP